MKRGVKPTADQLRFHNWLAEQGCAVCGDHAELHHCVGSSGKHNKIAIGQWFLIPVCSYHHRDTRAGIHAAGQWRKVLEKMFFTMLVGVYREEHENRLPCEPEVLEAIANYHQ